MSLPASPRQAAALSELLRECSGRTVIFDVDDTLLSTTERHRRILAEYAAHPSVRARFPEVKALSALHSRAFRYQILDTVRAEGYEEPAFLEDLKAFWFARFFRNEYLLADEPVAGAAEYCGAVEERGGRVLYLTGRDEAMREGTLRSLARHGFPEPGRGLVQLVLKPRFETPDHDFKTAALSAIAALGPVAGGFENEPAHVNLMADAFPGSRMMLVETRHSGRPVEPYPQVPRLRDFLL